MTDANWNEAKTWGMLAHLSALAGFFIPFGSVIGPLIIWQLKKEAHPFVDDQGKEAVNFQISLLIYGFIAFLTVFILIGFLLLPAVFIAGFILTLIGGIKANEGKYYRYPFSIRFFK